MPKGNINFKRRIDLYVTLEDFKRMKAIAYQRGDGDKYSTTARKMLNLGIETYLKTLDDKERADFDFIMGRMSIIERD